MFENGVMPETRSTLDIRGAHLALTDSGQEGLPVVVNAHGLTSSRASAIASTLGDYRAVGETGRRRLISYDARGHGESSAGSDRSGSDPSGSDPSGMDGAAAPAPEPRDFSWSELALDLLAVADRFSPEAPVSGIGLSMGTGTLLHAVTHLPGRFDRLVLSAPPTAWQTRAAQVDMYNTMAETVEGFASPDEARAALMTLIGSAPVPEVFRGLPNYPTPPAVSMEVLPTVFRGAALSDLPSFEALAEVTQPTLILAWEGDPGHPVSTAQKLAELLPNAELVVSSTTLDIQGWGARAAAFLG
jgi:3-oxoadipate enol-lactonase